MTIFKTFTLKWWQGSLFKWGVFLLGIAAGSYWHDFFIPYLALILILSALCLIYVSYVWWQQ